MSGDAGLEELVDLHCHFVPSVDDGAPDLAAALRWLRRGREAGVTRVVTTPHLPARLAGEAYRRRAEEAFRELRSATRAELPDLELRLAFEVRFDGTPVDPDDRGLWLGPGGHVLVEYSMLSLPEDPVAPLEPLLEAGRVPVLAHPERYRGEGEPGWARRVRAAGARLALNAGSLLGRYGPGPERAGRRLLAEGLADVVASDHHARSERSDGLPDVRPLLGGADPAAARRLLRDNPAAVLDGGAMEAVGPIDLPARGGRAADARGHWKGGVR